MHLCIGDEFVKLIGILDVFIQVLQEANVKRGLDVGEIYWGKYLRGKTCKEPEEAGRASRPQCR